MASSLHATPTSSPSDTTVQPAVLEDRYKHLFYQGSKDHFHVNLADLVEILSNSRIDTLTLRNVKVTDCEEVLESKEQPRFRLNKLFLYEVVPFGTELGFRDFLSLFNEIDEVMFVACGRIVPDFKDPSIPEEDMTCPWPPRADPTPTLEGTTRVKKFSLCGQLPPGAVPGDRYRKFWTTIYSELRSALRNGSLIEFVTVDNIYPFKDDRKTLEHLTFSPRNYDMISRDAQPVLSPKELWLLEDFSALKTLQLYNVAVPIPPPRDATLESHTNALTNALISVGYMLQRAPHRTLESVSVYLVYPIHTDQASPKYRLCDSGFWSTAKHLLQPVVCQEQFQTFRIVLPQHCPNPDQTKRILLMKLSAGEYADKFEVYTSERA